MAEPGTGAAREVAAPAATVYTIGHSTRAVEDLVALLQGQGITTLVDVRRFPGSRRHPQFGRDALAGALAAHGIDYTHSPGLGGRRPARPDSPNTAWRNRGFRGYADYMQTREFAEALAELKDLAARETVAILCAEAVPWRCHRRLIADALVVQGVRVLHILGPGRVEAHVLDPHARVRAGGILVYPASTDPQAGLFD
ncbi:MAG TPA: DUF488 domain-containing protein [Longimicrobiales bacterium]